MKVHCDCVTGTIKFILDLVPLMTKDDRTLLKYRNNYLGSLPYMGMEQKVQKVHLTFWKKKLLYFHSCFFALPDFGERGSGGEAQTPEGS